MALALSDAGDEAVDDALEGDPVEWAEVVGRAFSWGPDEVAARLERLIAGDVRRAIEGPVRVEVEEGGDRVRLVARTARSELLAQALQQAGARWVSVRLYPDEESWRAWSDFGRGGAGFALPEGVTLERAGTLGPTPKLVGPLVASAVIAVSLERLRLVSGFGAATVLLFFVLVSLLLAASARRNRMKWVRVGPKTDV